MPETDNEPKDRPQPTGEYIDKPWYHVDNYLYWKRTGRTPDKYIDPNNPELLVKPTRYYDPYPEEAE